ncbi:unnamed protein product [Hyaloperonospora brassicae]|uniref:PWI domain-containing protein n=1 Tax=Hyaloperonospora brassicae TaxID=162125 RepID=A0AAV0UHJ6_HYABA|nr:unnamed protein product [Hyaloperonospora brassicae]
MVQSNKSATTYAAIAAQAADALQALVQSTRVKVEPAVTFVSCGSPLHEHFVPESSLEKHLRKCHGERRPRLIHNAAFYYGRRDEKDGQDTQETTSKFIEEATSDIGARPEMDNSHSGDENATKLQSLLEPENVSSEEQSNRYDHDNDRGGITSALEAMATSAGSFYSQVQAWQRIPRPFATMKDNERKLVTSLSLCRWLNAELSRPGVLPNGEALDDELVDYVVGLVDHPDFCQPDRLVSELYEFLGRNVTTFVLALWKFLVIEIGLRSVFQNVAKSEKDVAVRVDSSFGSSHGSSKTSAVSVASRVSPSDARAEHAHKHHRASYRGKVGTKTGSAAYRDMIQKHMIGLSLETDRELVLGGGFTNKREEEKHPMTVHHSGRNPVDCWYNFTDALAVRNRSRKRQHDHFVGSKRRSRSDSKLNERRSVRRRSCAQDSNVHRKGSASPDRSRGSLLEMDPKLAQRCRLTSDGSEPAKPRHVEIWQLAKLPALSFAAVNKFLDVF